MPPQPRPYPLSRCGPVVAAFLCALLLWINSASAHVVVLSPKDQSLSLNTLFEHRTDAEGTLTVDAVTAEDEGWDDNGQQAFGYTRQVHWFRLHLLRPTQASGDWVLELGRPYVDDIRVYVGDGGKGWTEYRLGDHQPVASRPLASRLFAVPLALPADKPVTIMIRSQSTSATVLTASLWRPAAFAAQQSRDGLLFGVYYGALLVAVLFHFSIGLWIADRTHIIYAGFVLTQLVSYGFINGFAQLAFEQSWQYLSDRAINITNFSGSLLATWLWTEILQMRRNFPRLRIFYLGVMALYLFMLTIGWGRLYTDLAPLSFLLGMAVNVVTLATSARLLLGHPRQVTLWFYLLAFVVVNLGLLTHTLSLIGMIPLYLLPENLFQVSSIAHIVFLSAGLFYRVRQLDQEHSQAREEAISASARADGQRSLVAMLSHEFRTPLSMIHSAAQMVRFREPRMATGSLERLDRIEGTARRLSALIDVFLASDALDQGKIVLNPRQGDLSVLVERVLAQFGNQARRIRVSPFPPIRLTADHDLLAVALRNCLANALNYSPPQSPVHLTLIQTDEVVSLVVEDEGHGIAADELENIGTPYYRGQSSAGKAGSGLGISMVRTIIAAHGGAMTLESAPGAGTKITLSIKDGVIAPSRA